MDFKEKPVRIGRISKVHGVHGALVVECEYSINDFDNWPEWIFIYIDSGLVPFRLTEKASFVKDDKRLVIQITGISDPEDGSELLGMDIYMPESVLEYFVNVGFDYRVLEEYEVKITGIQGVGRIIEFLDISENPLFQIDFNQQEILIPAREEFILEIDERKQQIVFNVPEGLLDLN